MKKITKALLSIPTFILGFLGLILLITFLNDIFGIIVVYFLIPILCVMSFIGIVYFPTKKENKKLSNKELWKKTLTKLIDPLKIIVIAVLLILFISYLDKILSFCGVVLYGFAVLIGAIFQFIASNIIIFILIVIAIILLKIYKKLK